MKIYTKKGDKGYTTNILGEAIKKSDDRLELQGNVDELNAAIGHLRSLVEFEELDRQLRDVQYALFRLGTDISYGFEKALIVEADIKLLEEQIDLMTESFGKQQNFMYYSGHLTATYAHVVRAIARRAERSFVRAYVGNDYPLDMQYLNRLADYLYAVARYLNYKQGIEDEIMHLR